MPGCNTFSFSAIFISLHSMIIQGFSVSIIHHNIKALYKITQVIFLFPLQLRKPDIFLPASGIVKNFVSPILQVLAIPIVFLFHQKYILYPAVFILGWYVG